MSRPKKPKLKLENDPRWQELVARYHDNIYGFFLDVLKFNPTWQQADVIDQIQYTDCRVSISSGHGCFGKGTSIMKANGDCVPVESIAVDDQLMGDDGRSVRTVLALKRGQENMYRFTYADNTSHVFNESHILCLMRDGEYFTPTVEDYLFSVDVQQYEGMNPYRLLDGKHIELPIQSVEPLGLGDYYGFDLDGNSQFLGGDFTVLHNTGKTTLAAAFAFWKLICFYKSVFMFTATKIQQLRRTTWKEIRNFYDNIESNPHFSWLVDYIDIQAESIKIKGYDTGWQIFAQTAGKGNPEALAGMHAHWYTVWADEASGIPREHFDVIEGALTETHNAFILSSQPTRDSGFFYDTHDSMSVQKGGSWTPIVLNSEESPRVSAKWVKQQRQKFGGVDSPEYWIKVLGKFPERLDEYLITKSGIEPCFERKRIIEDSEYYGLFISVDVAAGVYRDSSVIMVSRVIGKGDFTDEANGQQARRVEVIEVPVFSKTISPVELVQRIVEVYNRYARQARILLDIGGMGGAVSSLLKGAEVDFYEVSWGGRPFNKSDKRRFYNLRALACVGAARAMREGRVKFLCQPDLRFKNTFIEQSSRIPYSFDDYARYRITPKEKMADLGLKSPDLFDTLAFMFLPLDINVVAKHNRVEQVRGEGVSGLSDLMV
ncbi:MAG: Hint domain-containing homing endonuclease [Pseudomonadota bacterium]|nr:Hint domain-containing homing endonuclease [Pseudomonadota bacterium]